MITGIELASFILAVFPLLISGLESYEEGFSTMKEWIRFRAEFASFMNALNRQKLFFRQGIEDLLTTVVDSDFEMNHMLENLDDERWKSPALELKLKARLSGKYEYECYLSAASSIHEILQKLKRKLNFTPDLAPWAQNTSSGIAKLDGQLRRFAYTLGKKKRQRLMDQLEKHNDDMRKLLGNSDRLEPMRKQRRSAMPGFFEAVRHQASSLHSALAEAWGCDCKSGHLAKFMLTKPRPRPRQDSVMTNPTASEIFRLNVYFPLSSQTWASSSTLVEADDSWCATEIEMVEVEAFSDDQSFSTRDDTSSLQLGPSQSHDSRSQSISFQSGSNRRSSVASSIPNDAVHLPDLCSALKQHTHSQQYLGYLRDGSSRYHTIYLPADSALPSTQPHQVLSLESILSRQHDLDKPKSFPVLPFPRRTRLSIAVILATSLLQLHTGPWLDDTWGKKDVYFFRNENGEVQADHPFLIQHFKSTKDAIESSDHPPAKRTGKVSNPSLISLGILILELWFNDTIESRPFYDQFLGPDGKENEYTVFNTAQKWQEQALEEGGLDLHNPTRRCIYCAFGATSQDLNNQELQKAVYDDVVQPLERLLARYEED